MNADTEAPTAVEGTRNGTRDLHVKAIPESVWVRARCAATRSRMRFKEYIVKLLGACQPISDDAPAPEDEA